jgi:guanylate kinase
VTQDEYDRLRLASTAWDHTEVLGISYGTDASLINECLAKGQNYIICAPADVAQLKEFQDQYQADHTVVWIDTELAVANDRLRQRDGAVAKTRIEAPTQTEQQLKIGRRNAGISFQPSGRLRDDEKSFISLISYLLESSG